MYIVFMLIIFDLDGTLFQAKPVILLAARGLLYELGVPAPDENRLLRRAAQGAEAMLLDLLGDGVYGEGSLARYEEHLRDAILEQGELFPGVYKTVEALAGEGHDMAVCSNSPERYIHLVLEHFGIAKWIPRFCSAESSPSKAAMISDLVKTGIPAVVVGDTHGDIEAAHINGLPVIAAMYGYGNKELLMTADGFAESALEIIPAIAGLTK